jgi:GAF domain-containing protein
LKRPPILIGEGIAGYVAKVGQPILTNDVNQFKHLKTSDDKAQYKTGSFISLPLKIGNRVIGVVNVNNKYGGSSFSQEDLLVLEILNAQILLSLRNAQLLNDQRNQIRTAQVLNEIDQVIIQQEQPEEMFSVLLNRCIGMLECETLILFMLDSEFNQDVLYVRSFLSIMGGIKEPAVLSPTEGIEGMILNIKKPVLISNAENDERISIKVRKMVHTPIKSIAAYPIILFDKVIGIIEAVNKQKQPKFTREDLYLMKQLTYKIFLALMKNNLYNEKVQIETRLKTILNRIKTN